MIPATTETAPAAAVRLRLDATPQHGPWQWRLDLSHGPDHDTLLDLITDTDLALGTELVERACTCTTDASGCIMVLAPYGHALLICDHRVRQRAR
ncbi:hypothetical protein ACIOGZ_29675 [Kitasatospora sp. NPDC088160]|uniref:hypothetical protein n=1 Tax=Kitasatospora sp. NPDC088160 TaxID=3364072 RepID=UPI0037F4591A